MEQSDRKYGLWDMHDIDPSGCEISNRVNKDFFKTVLDSSILRERIAKAEQLTGEQTTVTAMLYGRDDGAQDVPHDKEMDMQEKIWREKKRMVTGETI